MWAGFLVKIFSLVLSQNFLSLNFSKKRSAPFCRRTMLVKIVVLLVIGLLIFLQPFSQASISFSYRHENASEFKESFVFKICSVILEETEWKYMSIIMLDAAELELSEDFMMNFHDEVCQSKGHLSLVRVETNHEVKVCNFDSWMHHKKERLWSTSFNFSLTEKSSKKIGQIK